MTTEQKQIVADLKEKIKDLTNEIKHIKAERGHPCRSKYEYRHHHIVASLLRGTPRERIEQPRDCNLPNELYIEKLHDKYLTMLEGAEGE